MCGSDTQATRSPARHGHRSARPGPLHMASLPQVNQEYEQLHGRKVIEDFPEWEPCHRAILSAGICGFENVGGDIDKVTGMRVTFAAFPWRWKKGTAASCGSSRMVDPSGKFRIETGKDQ